MTFAVAVGLLLAFSGRGASRHASNLVLNGGFEESIAPWSTTQASVLRRATGVARFGKASASLAARADEPYGMYTLGAVVRPRRGARYALSGWVKGTGRAIGARVAIQLTEHAGAFPDQPVVLDYASVTGSWTRLGGTGTVVRADREALDVFIVVQRPNAARETVYVDGVSLTKVAGSGKPEATGVTRGTGSQ